MHAIKWHGKFSDPREPEEGQQMHQMHSNFADLHFFMFVTFILFYNPKGYTSVIIQDLWALQICSAKGHRVKKNWFVLTVTFLPNNLKKGLEEQSFSWQPVLSLWWSGPIKTNISHSISMRSQFSWYNNKQTKHDYYNQQWHKKEFNQQLGTRHQNNLARGHIIDISYKDILLPMLVLEMN